MLLERSRTFRRARQATIALTTAALIVIAEDSLAQRDDRPPLDVPYVPTPPEVIDHMLDLAQLRPDDYLIDLGSGDGRIAIAAGKKGVRALGIDIDPERVLEAQDNSRKAGLNDLVQFRRQNLFDTKLSEATVVTLYLPTKVNLDLRPRLLAELKPGTRVVSHSFDMGDWIPDVHSEIGQRHVYLWIVPAKAAGRWQVQNGAESFTLVIEQKYQYLSGSARIAGRDLAISEGWLHGNTVHLTLADGTKLAGRIDGDRIDSAPPARSGAARPWHAIRVR